MNIPSRTPEGQPNRCRFCGHEICIEPSTPPGDAPCPHCGCLVWFASGAEPPKKSSGIPRIHRQDAVRFILYAAVILPCVFIACYFVLPALGLPLNLGPWEWGILCGIALLLFGRRLPEVGRFFWANKHQTLTFIGLLDARNR